MKTSVARGIVAFSGLAATLVAAQAGEAAWREDSGLPLRLTAGGTTLRVDPG